MKSSSRRATVLAVAVCAVAVPSVTAAARSTAQPLAHTVIVPTTPTTPTTATPATTPSMAPSPQPSPSSGPSQPSAPSGSPGAAYDNPIPSKFRNQKIDWTLCDEPTGTQCALIAAPLDWRRPMDGRVIRVAISKTSGADGTNARTVIGNPGGPGGPGLGMAPFLAQQPGLKGHLAVGFDPRGTGSSTVISCAGAPDYTMDQRDRDRITLRVVARASALWQDYCRIGSQGRLDYVNTWQTVRDMDLIRQLLGYASTDYVGYSGGTWLGAHYQKAFPKAVGRFVLDSNTDFTREWEVTFGAQPQSFQRRFEQDFQTWVARYDSVFGMGSRASDVAAYYENLRADLKAAPISIDVFGLAVVIDQNLLDRVIVGGMYSKTSFQSTAETMQALRGVVDEYAASGMAAAGRRAAALPARIQHVLVAAAKPALPGLQPLAQANETATFIAITCNDTAWHQGQAFWDRTSARLGRAYPLIGWSENQQPCGYWTRPEVTLPRPDGRGIGTTIMVQSVNDPATNSSLGFAAHARYAGSRLITVTKEGDHGIYGGVNPCVDTIVNAYLSTGAAPSRDATCVGTGTPAPQPAPTPAPDARTAQGGPGSATAGPLAEIAALSERIGVIG